MNKTNNKMSSERHIDFVNNMKRNLNKNVGDMTLPEIAEHADVPFSTLKNILYGNSKDCKLSTAVKLAHSLSITIDELVGAETIPHKLQESISVYRNLPERSQYLVRWFIRHQEKICNDSDFQKNITVMIPRDSNGYLLPSNVFESMNIDSFPNNIKAKVFTGLKIMTDCYMPYYSPFDTLLLANDRHALKNERCVIVYYGKIKIVTRREVIRNGATVVEYTPIQNPKGIIQESEIDELMGYIAEVYKEP